MTIDIFTYENKTRRGGFLLSEVIGWSNSMDNPEYLIYTRGFCHILFKQEFDEFHAAWIAYLSIVAKQAGR